MWPTTTFGSKGCVIPFAKWRRSTQLIPIKEQEMAPPRHHRYARRLVSATAASSRPQGVVSASVSAGSLTTTVSDPLQSITPGVEMEEDHVSEGALEMESTIETLIYRFRFMTLFAVLGSLFGSILCFLKGCGYVMDAFTVYFLGGGKVISSGGKVISTLIEAIDIYLIGTVMLVFGMGLYELFISNLDMAETSSCGSNFLGLFRQPERPKWLEIQSVNELKTKLGHVIVMVLLVGLFEKSKKVIIHTPRDLLCFSASILLSSCGLYLLSMLGHSKRSKLQEQGTTDE